MRCAKPIAGGGANSSFRFRRRWLFCGGPDHVFEHVNDEYQRVVGRSIPQLLGKPLRDVFPELDLQGHIQVLNGVYRTGIPYAAKEALFQLDVHGDGVLQDIYVNFVYNAIRDDAGRIDGIFVHAVTVTDLVTARRRIEETNQRFILALSATRGLVYELDLKSGRVTREPGVEDLTGWKTDEAPSTSRWWMDQIHPEDLQRFTGWRERVAADQTMRVLTYRIRHRNGDWKWVEDHALIHRDEAGEISRVIGIGIDITAREQAQEELRQSRERFQTAVRAVSDLVWTNNARGEMEGDQPGWGGFTGQSYDDYQGYGWAKAVHPEDAQPTIDAWNEAVAERKMFVFEHRVRRHDGVWRLFSIRALPIPDAGGAVREWVGVHTDITDRRRAEEDLRQSEARFRQLAESMPQIVWTTTPDFVCDYINSRWTELTGCDLAATQDGAFRARMLPEDLAAIDRAANKGLRAGEPFSFECRFPALSGKPLRWCLVRAVPVRDANGEVVKWLGTSTDIDERKETETALARANEELTRANADLEQFGYSASHDLQEPLRSVMIYSELLVRDYSAKLDDKALEMLGYLRGGASRMERLIRDLLAYTQVKKLDAAEDSDSMRVMEDVLANLANAITESGAKIEYGVLPSVGIHQVHLQQLFQNLIGNALKYRSEKRPLVRVAAEKKDGQWLFSVSDNGIGISAEYHERIFGLFKRLHSGDQYLGTGIGLAICKRTVERYGGRIWVEAEPEKGSTFYFTVPV